MEEQQACLLKTASWESDAQLPQGAWAYMDEPAVVESQFVGEDDEEEEVMGAEQPLSGEDGACGYLTDMDPLGPPKVSFSTSTELCPEPVSSIETPDSLGSSEECSPDLEWTENPLSVGQYLGTGDAELQMHSLDQKSDSSQEYDLSSSDREESGTQIQEEESPTPTLQEEIKADDEVSLYASERHQVALCWTANGNTLEETEPHEGSSSENVISMGHGTEFEFTALVLARPTELAPEATEFWNRPQTSTCILDVEPTVEENDSKQTESRGMSTAPAETVYKCRACATEEEETEKLEDREGMASPYETNEDEENDEQAEEQHSTKSSGSVQHQEQRNQQMPPTEGEENKNIKLSEVTNHPGLTDQSEQPEEVDLNKPVKLLEPTGESEEQLSQKIIEQPQQTDDTKQIRQELLEHKFFHEEPCEDTERCTPQSKVPEIMADTETTKESKLTETIEQTDVKDPSELLQQLEEPRQPEKLEENSLQGENGPESAATTKETLQTADMQQTQNQEDMKESNSSQANGDVVDREEARRLAERLYHLDNVRHTDVVKHMDKDNDFSRAVGEEYLKFFDFTGQSLDQSLRSFLKVVVLIGETQERERVLEHFAHRFHQCNPSNFSSQGAVLTLTCAVMLLNTDLHGQNVGKAMTVSSFVSNLESMNEGENFCKDMLKNLYNGIKNEPLEWAIDEEELKSSLVLPGEEKADVPPRSKSNPFQDVPHDKKATVFKQGFLTRKAHADIDGKRTPWGKRSWKTFYAVLKGMVLYLQKDEYRMEWQSSEEVVSVHHALAEKAEDYTKKPHVFRLQTADWRVFLFQASTAEQMSSWICRINLVSALYSSPPFPAAVGSQRKFSRPILPATQSALSMEKQLQSHCHMLESFSQDLAELLQNPPEGRKAKARELEDYKLREEYLQHEKSRYEIYKQMLEKWKGLGGEVGAPVSTALLDSFDNELCLEMGEEEADSTGLKKSHSSPSLNLELAPPPVVKVKRNISERRTYRKIIIPRRNREL